MKCPKCGYNSFEFHDTCKRCSIDLTGYKETHGLKPIVLPSTVRSNLAAKLMAEMNQADQTVTDDAPPDMFSFDIPEVPSAIESFPLEDPFSFDDEPVLPAVSGGDLPARSTPMSAQDKAEEEAFADLLESTNNMQKPAIASVDLLDTAEDLNNFSWDDTPLESPSETPKPADDFDSLFGDTDKSAKK